MSSFSPSFCRTLAPTPGVQAELEHNMAEATKVCNCLAIRLFGLASILQPVRCLTCPSCVLLHLCLRSFSRRTATSVFGLCPPLLTHRFTQRQCPCCSLSLLMPLILLSPAPVGTTTTRFVTAYTEVSRLTHLTAPNQCNSSTICAFVCISWLFFVLL